MFVSKNREERSAMDILQQNKQRNYTPISPSTRLKAVKRALGGRSLEDAAEFYHVGRSSVARWLKAYRARGEEGLSSDKSHRPHTPCAWAIGKEVVYKIECLRRQAGRSNLSTIDIWAKAVKQTGENISYSTVLRYVRRGGGVEPYRPAKKNRHDKKYHTPDEVGVKWQMDVKFVPAECKAPTLSGSKSFFQYTVIDEASRKRFLHFTEEHNMNESVAALKLAIAFFGYQPEILQTDNGTEFTDKAFRKEGAKHARPYPSAMEKFTTSKGIDHRTIKPGTPEHNGKVERSHRTDQDRFYRGLSFYSLEDLRNQGAAWMKRYNATPKRVLGLRSPNEAELDSLKRLYKNNGEVRCPKLLKSLTSLEP